MQIKKINDITPAQKFMTTLSELFAAKRVFVKEVNDISSIEDCKAKFIGWEDQDFYYLIPEVTYTEVSIFTQQQGSAFPVTKSTLWKHLEQAGYVKTAIEGGQSRADIKKAIGGKRQRVVCVYKQALENI